MSETIFNQAFWKEFCLYVLKGTNKLNNEDNPKEEILLYLYWEEYHTKEEQSFEEPSLCEIIPKEQYLILKEWEDDTIHFSFVPYNQITKFYYDITPLEDP